MRCSRRRVSSSATRASAARRAAASRCRAAASRCLAAVSLSRGGFLAETGFQFLSGAERGARCRIVKAKLPRLQAQLQAQYRTAQHQPARSAFRCRQRLILASAQLAALQRRLQVVSRRVVLPVLPHPQPALQLSLRALIFLSRAARRHLQHEVRRLLLLPQQVRGAPVVGRSQHHEHVRRHRCRRGCPLRSTAAGCPIRTRPAGCESIAAARRPRRTDSRAESRFRPPAFRPCSDTQP